MKTLLIILSYALLISAASAIVIIPPVVYFATISLVSLSFNLFVGFFFWIAIQGIASKNFFGKPFHSITGFIISSAGKLAFALALAIALVTLLSPISPEEMLFTAGLASLAFAIALFLSRFRFLRNSREKAKGLASITVFALAVFAITFCAISLSVELVELNTGKQGNLGDIAGLPLPEKQMSSAPYADTAYEGKYGEITEALWLEPDSLEDCLVSIGQEEIVFHPSEGCLSQGPEFKRRTCPIKLRPFRITQRGLAVITASGSCSGSISVRISDEGFEVLQ